MRIGFDGKRVVQNFTGLGNYSRFVLNLLAEYFPENEYLTYSSKKNTGIVKHPERINFRHPESPILPAIWRSYGILKDLKKDKVDLYHGLSNELPVGIKTTKIPAVVTIHDLIFLRFPQFYPFADRSIYRFKFKYACNNASRIIAVSEQTKKDIINYFSVPADNITVVYQGCNALFKTKSTSEHKHRIRTKYSLPRQFILQVGTIERRKNLLLTIKALTNISSEIKLVVIGKQTEYMSEVAAYMSQNTLEDRVIFLKDVPAEDLPAIYQQAEIFVYPSEFEGFGIPIIEALCSGVPVIAATGSCLEEAGGPGSCYIHPKDDIQLSQNITAILDSNEVRQKMIIAGYEYVKKFSDEQLASDLINVYKKVLSDA